MDIIKLRKPIMINGSEVKELTYDTAEITCAQFCEAEAARFAAGGNKPSMNVYEFDSALHLYLGMMAVIAVNPHIDVKDLERIKGVDMIKLAQVGRNFILSGAAEDSDLKTSEDASEPTAEPSSQVQES